MNTTNSISDFNCTSNQLTNENCLIEFLLKTRPELIRLIPKHWLYQQFVSYDLRICVAILFLVICVPTNIGHLVVFATYGRSRTLRTASNRLLLSLLLADFLLLANCYLFIYQAFLGYPIAGIYGCKAGGFLGTVAALSEIWSLSAVSLDRFRYIHYPLQYDKRITKSQANKIILFVWSTAILFSTFPLLGWSSYMSESFLMGCSFNMYSSDWNPRSYCYVLLIFCYFIPLCIVFFSYLGIIYHNSRLSNKRIPNPSTSVRYVARFSLGDNSSQREEKTEETIDHVFQSKMSIEKQSTRTYIELKDSKEQHQLSQTFLLLIFVWVIAWTPYAILIAWIMGFEAYGITPIIGLVPVFFCKLSASANVMLYGLRVPDFKFEVGQTIQRLFFPTHWMSIFSDISSLETNNYSRRHRSSDMAATNKKMSLKLQRTRSAPNIKH